MTANELLRTLEAIVLTLADAGRPVNRAKIANVIEDYDQIELALLDKGIVVLDTNLISLSSSGQALARRIVARNNRG